MTRRSSLMGRNRRPRQELSYRTDLSMNKSNRLEVHRHFREGMPFLWGARRRARRIFPFDRELGIYKQLVELKLHVPKVTMEDSFPYKTCRSCGATWKTPLDVILDKKLRVNGYQTSLPDARDGLVLLTHELPDCRSTLAVFIRDFKFLYDGPEYTELPQSEAECPGSCFEQSDLEPCGVACSMSWARKVLQYFRNHEVPLRHRSSEPKPA